jgi:hypothetical protein
MADDVTDEIVFGGLGTTGVMPTPPDGARSPAWASILEQAFFQLTSDPAQRELYGDPGRGATLVQAWRTAQLFGTPPPVCLLATGQPRVAAAGIPAVVLVPKDELVRLVCGALHHRARSAVQLFVFDGRTGHAVSAHSADPDCAGITFHDSWPGDSLLSKAQNAAGADARRVGDAWRITAGDLELVLVAAFIAPAIWASMSGQPGLPTLTELRSSDLWSFFHLSESGRDDSDPTYVSIAVQTEGFREHNEIQLRCNEKDEICSAVLRLRQSWVFGPPYGINPFATDIAASWLATLVPQKDRLKLDPLIRELRSLRLDERLRENSQRAEWSRSDVGRLVAAYLGLDDHSFASSQDLSFLTVETSKDPDGTAWTQLRLALG